MLGSKVRFRLIVFKANLKASSSAPEGPLSMDSNIPPGEGGRRKQRHEESLPSPVTTNGMQTVTAPAVQSLLNPVFVFSFFCSAMLSVTCCTSYHMKSALHVDLS